MNSASEYRVYALKFTAMARAASKPQLQTAYAAIAQSYLRLAVLAERNAKTDVVYETPPLRPEEPARRRA